MARFLAALFIVFIVFCGAIAQNDPSYPFKRLKISLDPQTQLGQLVEEHPELIVEHVGKDYAEVKLLKTDFDQFKKRGVLNYEEVEARNPDYSGYTTSPMMEVFLKDMAARYPTITRLFSIGKSVRGTDLWVIEIAARPGVEDGLPLFKYIGNMHGDEVVGREMLVRLIRHLCEGYGSNLETTQLVNSIHIYIMPTMNPDGFDMGQRENAHYKDLNRNFPDRFARGIDLTGDPDSQYANCEPEVLAVREWVKSKKWVLSANLHGGDVVANYPWDGNASGFSAYTGTRDDDIFRQVALAYSMSNPVMFASRQFTNGITNGAAWYTLYGGMQDWNYIWMQCMEITLELSMIKWPPGAQLDQFWEENRISLLKYIAQVNVGIRGTVLDYATKQPILASISVQKVGVDTTPRDYVVTSSNVTGSYFRLLSPGTYRVTASAKGYQNVTRLVEVLANRYTNVSFAMCNPGSDCSVQPAYVYGDAPVSPGEAPLSSEHVAPRGFAPFGRSPTVAQAVPFATPNSPETNPPPTVPVPTSPPPTQSPAVLSHSLDGEPNEDDVPNTGAHTVAILFSVVGALIFVAAVFVFLWYRRRARAIEYASVAHSGIDGYAFSVDSDPEGDGLVRGEDHDVELESGQ